MRSDPSSPVRLTLVIVCIALSSVGLTLRAAADVKVAENAQPILLALHEWTGQQVTTRLAGSMLEVLGYRVEYLTAGAYTAALALANGELAASLEVWSNNLGEHYPRLLASGQIERLGELGLVAQEGWLYPQHMAKACPGLPAWQAFLGCSRTFATPETWPLGRFVDYPAEWGARASRLIEEEALPFAAIPGGSEGAMLAEMRSATVRRTPLVMMFWAPHWVLSRIEHGWVEIPEPLRARYGLERPSVFKAAWPGLRARWPTAHRLLSGFTLDNDTQQRLVNRIDNHGEPLQAVARQWVTEHRATWMLWVQ